MRTCISIEKTLAFQAALTRTGIWHQFLPGVQGAEVVLPVDAQGKYVRVQLAGGGPLSLTEVEVYGVAESALVSLAQE